MLGSVGNCDRGLPSYFTEKVELMNEESLPLEAKE